MVTKHLCRLLWYRILVQGVFAELEDDVARRRPGDDPFHGQALSRGLNPFTVVPELQDEVTRIQKENAMDPHHGLNLITVVQYDPDRYGFLDWFSLFETADEAALRFVRSLGLNQGGGCPPGDGDCVARGLAATISKYRSMKFPAWVNFPEEEENDDSESTCEAEDECQLQIPMAPAGITIHTVGTTTSGKDFHYDTVIFPCHYEFAAGGFEADKACRSLVREIELDSNVWLDECITRYSEVLERFHGRLKSHRHLLKAPWKVYRVMREPRASFSSEAAQVVRSDSNRTLDLTVPWYSLRRTGRPYGLQSCSDLYSTSLCHYQLGQQQDNGLCPCSDRISDFLLDTPNSDSSDSWVLDNEATIRHVFHNRITTSQCVFPKPGVSVTRAELSAAAGFPLSLWEILEPEDNQQEKNEDDRLVTGVASDVACREDFTEEPVHVWFNTSDMVFFGLSGTGYFDVPG
jgi:hypothetical protein